MNGIISVPTQENVGIAKKNKKYLEKINKNFKKIKSI